MRVPNHNTQRLERSYALESNVPADKQHTVNNGPARVKNTDLPAWTEVPMQTDTGQQQQALRITYQSSHTFDTTRARLDEQIPLLDPLVSLDLVLRHASWDEVESTISAYLGPTGFVALARIDQGALLSLSGEPLGATRYLVGNPLLARRVLGADPAAALYAPFGVAVFADRAGVVQVSYDHPSSLFATCGTKEITDIGRELDDRIRSAVVSACSA
jgi:uncharacterized protein (DUF302 family)